MHRASKLRGLGEVEQLVMDYIWSRGSGTAEACREALASKRPMKDSTIRTILRRLEEKGYVTHETSGRAYVYRPAAPRQSVAVRAVQQIVDRFLGGSVEDLLVGMVENEVLEQRELETLMRRIAQRRGKKP